MITTEVKSMCDELLKAKTSGKLSQDQMEYELAKLTLEMLGEYRPKQIPAMRGELASFEVRARSEWAALSPERLKSDTARFDELKAKYKSEISHINADNKSNAWWLLQCLETFKKNNNPKWHEFQHVIAEHQGAF